MSATVVSLCNMALARLGVDQQITALTDTSATARACSLFYEQCRDEVLRAHDWAFAERRATLALVSGTAPSPWVYQYRYPSDCLKARAIALGTVIASNDQRIPYEIVSDTTGRLILTDEVDAVLIYTALITDPVQFHADFVAALAWKLAESLAMPITKLGPVRDRAEQGYLLAIQRAVTGESSEMQDQPYPASAFERART